MKYLTALITTAWRHAGHKGRTGLALLILAAALPQLTWADCRLDPVAKSIEYTFNLPASISLPRNLPNGSDITTATSSSRSPGSGVGCDAGTQVVATNFARNGATSTAGITPTGVPGIGMRWTTGHLFSQTLRTATQFSGANATTLTLVKTGPIADGAMLTAGALAWTEVNGLVNTRDNLATTVRLIPRTCNVTTNVQVSISPAAGIPLRTFTRVGTTTNMVPFQIGIDCTGVRTTVFMTFTDQRNPANTSDTLGLTANSVATGIGIQIMSEENSIGSGIFNVRRFGPANSVAGNTNQFKVAAPAEVSQGPQQINFRARYIQTAAQVTAGTANGIATFTMSYQ